MNKKLLFISVFSIVILPLAVSAVVWPSAPAPGTINVRTLIGNILNFIWPVVVAVIIFTFGYAGFQFLFAYGDPVKIATARKAVIWGIAGVIVVMLAFSIVAMVQFALGIFRGFGT